MLNFSGLLRRIFLRSSVAVSLLAPAQASTFERQSFVEIAQGAALIVVGLVEPGSRRVELRDRIPWTCLRVKVERLLKGNAGPAVEFCFLGGASGDEIVHVSGMNLPSEGRRGVFFSYELSRNYVSPIVGWSHGIFYIADSPAGEVVTTENGLRITAIDVSSTARADPDAPSVASGVVTAASGQTGANALSLRDFITAIHQAMVARR